MDNNQRKYDGGSALIVLWLIFLSMYNQVLNYCTAQGKTIWQTVSPFVYGSIVLILAIWFIVLLVKVISQSWYGIELKRLLKK